MSKSSIKKIFHEALKGHIFFRGGEFPFGLCHKDTRTVRPAGRQEWANTSYFLLSSSPLTIQCHFALLWPHMPTAFTYIAPLRMPARTPSLMHLLTNDLLIHPSVDGDTSPTCLSAQPRISIRPGTFSRRSVSTGLVWTKTPLEGQTAQMNEEKGPCWLLAARVITAHITDA